jgi:hypothetical protein
MKIIYKKFSIKEPPRIDEAFANLCCYRHDLKGMDGHVFCVPLNKYIAVILDNPYLAHRDGYAVWTGIGVVGTVWAATFSLKSLPKFIAAILNHHSDRLYK